MVRRVEFAYPREVGGKNYKQGEVAELDKGVAATLIAEGFARPAAEKKDGQPSAKKEG